MTNTNKAEKVADYFSTNTARTKVAKAAYSWYQKQSIHTSDLSYYYVRHSSAKDAAMNYCKDLMYRFNGYGLSILSYNCQTFAVGFEFINPEDGNVMFAYITRAYNSCCDI